MNENFKKAYSQAGTYILFGLTIFVVGLLVGYYRAPEVSRVAGVINSTPDIGQLEASATILKCIDSDGNDISCNETDKVKDRVLTIPSQSVADFNQFWRAWNLINERYVPVKGEEVSHQEKIWGAIAGLAESLGDPYTFFLPPKEKKLFEQDVAGSFGGVGMQIGLKDGLPTIIAPLKNSPAERAGIMSGDRIVEIDGVSIKGLTVDTILYKIRGEIGTKVQITLSHSDGTAPYTVTITREEIKAPTIETEKKDGVFIIRLFSFTQTAGELFGNAMTEFQQSGIKKLIIDVRGNPGGYLETSVDIASWFLPGGKIVVEESGKGEHHAYRSYGHPVNLKDTKIVILVDEGSASASEILAGALQQHGVATLIGAKTFGKGSVQELIPITMETSLKLTVARWIMPNGKTLTDGGIDPDISVPVSKQNVEKGADPQLIRALEFLNDR